MERPSGEKRGDTASNCESSSSGNLMMRRGSVSDSTLM
jgi:hypothetical protein